MTDLLHAADKALKGLIHSKVITTPDRLRVLDELDIRHVLIYHI